MQISFLFFDNPDIVSRTTLLFTQAIASPDNVPVHKENMTV